MSTGDIINDSWILLKRIGKGSFSEIFLAQNLHVDRSYVAIKVHKPTSDPSLPAGAGAAAGSSSSSVLIWEGLVLRMMNGVRSAPKFIHSDTHKDKYEYVAMEYLGGEDMSKLRDSVRSSLGSIPVNVVCYLMLQMVQGTEDLHEKGFIHRDIKPANFVRRSRTSTEFCMLDFGISKRHRESNGEVRKKRTNTDFRGTNAYASPHAHNKEDLCPRDDAYSLWFAFLDLLCGQLPWTEAARERDKQRVAEIKRSHLDDPDKLADWAYSTFIASHTPLGDVTESQAEQLRDSCLIVLRHLASLRFEDTPDFSLLRSAVKSVLADANSDILERVSRIDYRERGFTWCDQALLEARGADKGSCGDSAADAEAVGGAEFARLMSDKHALHNIFMAKGKYLGRQLTREMEKQQQHASSAGVVNTVTVSEPFLTDSASAQPTPLGLSRAPSASDMRPHDTVAAVQSSTNANDQDAGNERPDSPAVLYSFSAFITHSQSDDHMDVAETPTHAQESATPMTPWTSQDLDALLSTCIAAPDREQSAPESFADFFTSALETNRPVDVVPTTSHADTLGTEDALGGGLIGGALGSLNTIEAPPLLKRQRTGVHDEDMDDDDVPLAEIAAVASTSGRPPLPTPLFNSTKTQKSSASAYQNLLLLNQATGSGSNSVVGSTKGSTAAPESVNNNVPRVPLSLGTQWRVLVTDLLCRFESRELRRELIDLYESILRDFRRFYYAPMSREVPAENGIDIGGSVDEKEDEDVWKEFIEIQRVAYQFTEKIRKRHRP